MPQNLLVLLEQKVPRWLLFSNTIMLVPLFFLKLRKHVNISFSVKTEIPEMEHFCVIRSTFCFYCIFIASKCYLTCSLKLVINLATVKLEKLLLWPFCNRFT